MSAPNLRARKAPLPPSTDSPAPTIINPPPRRSTTSSSSNWPSILDILRLLTGLLLLSFLLSYFITGNSLLWGYRPAWTRPTRIKAFFTGPLHLTDAQLALYNGTDTNLPILLALNGTIYDVSASRHLYGPGGAYGFFAGKDATRGFVTGCFGGGGKGEGEGDLNGDLRGVEEMFMPVDDDGDVDGEHGGASHEEEKGEAGPGAERIDKRERKLRRERERRAAKKQVWNVVDGWRKMFDGGKGGKYFKRGEVDRGEGSGWQGWGEVKELCEKAMQGRPRRTAEQV